MGFLKNIITPDFSKYKGNAYVFKMSNFDNQRAHTIE